MRLIDATKLEDLLRRQMEMDWNKQAAPASWSAAYEQILEELVDAPTVDAVPVVRCRDCKHRVKNSCDSVEFYECDHMGLGQTRVGVKDDFFCADGEREGRDENEQSCETCIHYPPSSFGGKPCCVCETSDWRTSCYERRNENAE